MENGNYINELKTKLENLRDEITILQKEIQSIFEKIEEKQKSVNYIVELLRIENVDINKKDIEDISIKSVPDIVYDYLSTKKDKESMHYLEIFKNIYSNGILIPGKNPAANLLTQINKDNRFVRVAPGTYGLTEWGLQPVLKKRKINRKKVKKNRGQ